MSYHNHNCDLVIPVIELSDIDWIENGSITTYQIKMMKMFEKVQTRMKDTIVMLPTVTNNWLISSIVISYVICPVNPCP